MKTFKIKTHRPGATYHAPPFFILNKGNNAGRPSHCPFNNAFVVFADSTEEVNRLYWIYNILYSGHNFKTRLCGSLIPFIHIGEIESLMKNSLGNYEGHHWNGRFTALEKLERLSIHLLHQQRCLEEYKIALMQSYDLVRD